MVKQRGLNRKMEGIKDGCANRDGCEDLEGIHDGFNKRDGIEDGIKMALGFFNYSDMGEGIKDGSAVAKSSSPNKAAEVLVWPPDLPDLLPFLLPLLPLLPFLLPLLPFLLPLLPLESSSSSSSSSSLVGSGCSPRERFLDKRRKQYRLFIRNRADYPKLQIRYREHI
jgi:hypothetical protein